MKRITLFLLATAMILSLCACGGGKTAPSETAADKPAVGAAEPVSSPSGSGTVQASAEIQRAIDASDKLTTGSYLLLDDGSVVTRGESWGDFARDCAALQNVSKIIVSSSQMNLFFLTDEGDLYYRQTKIKSGVTDIIYSTTNTNESAVFISDGRIYAIRVQSTGDVNADLRSKNPDHYFDVDGKTVSYYELIRMYSNLDMEHPVYAEGDLVRLSAEKSDFFILNDAGRVFMDNNAGYSEEYVGHECKDWTGIVRIDAAKVMLSSAKDADRKVDLTIAGIQSDGTVLAAGTYADEILSWGKLNDISMDDGLIIGLAPDGSLKLAGPTAEFVESDLSGWSDIVGIKVGNITGTTVVNAIEADGTYHHLEYDERWLENTVATVSAENGCADDSSGAWYRYCPDGTVLRSSGENGRWA